MIGKIFRKRNLETAKKVFASFMIPIFILQMCSLNFVLANVAKAEEITVVETVSTLVPEAPAEKPTPKVEEVAPVKDVVEPVAPAVVSTPEVVEPVEDVVTPTEPVTEPVAETPAPTDVPTLTEQPSTGDIDPTPATAEVLVPVAVETWGATVGNKATTNDKVEKDVKYVAPQNSEVTVTFTEINGEPGTLSIEEITLTPEQVKTLGALSNKAYDITSDMADGTFAYDLTLPKPANQENVEIKFAETKAGLLENADTVAGSDVTTQTDSVSAALDHFTLFVVTTQNITVDPLCNAFDCFNSLQTAINNASAGDIIFVSEGAYNESVVVNKNLTFQTTTSGTATPISFSGSFTVNSGVTLTMVAHNETFSAGTTFTNSGTIISTTAGEDLTFTSAGNFTVGDITSVANVSITSTGGDIKDDASGAQSTYITGTNITLSALAGKVGDYDTTIANTGDFNKAVDVKLGSGTLNATALNDVAVTEIDAASINTSKYVLTSNIAGKYVIFGNMKTGGNLTVDSALDGDSLLRLVAGGNIIVSNAISTSANTASLYAKGNVTLNSSITASGTSSLVKINAGFDSGTGSIIDDGSQITTISAKDVALNANGGSVSNVTPAGNGTINFLNAVDVALGGGTLTTNGGYVTETSGVRNGTYTLGGGNISLSKAFSGIGASLTSDNGKLTISDDDTTAGNILIGEYSGAVAGGLTGAVSVGNYYEIQTEGVVSLPVNVQLAYTDGEITTAGLPSDNQLNGVYYYDTAWHMYPVGSTTVHRDTNIINISASHLTPMVAGADVTVPTVAITAPTSGSVDGSTAITFTDNEPTNPQCSVNGTDWVSCTSDTTTLGNIPQFLAKANGVFTLSLKDTDLVGNIGTDNKSVTKNDITAPVVAITPLSPDPNNDNTPTFNGTVSDVSSNIASVEYEIDGSGTWLPATASDGSFNSNNENYTFTTATLSDASHAIRVRATDVASVANVATPISDTFTIDSTAPTFTMQYYSDSGLATPLADNPKLKAGTYYIKITASETLTGTPTISIASEGTANDVTNGATASVSGLVYKYTRTIAYDLAAVGAVKEDISVSGIDAVNNHANNVDPTNESTGAAYTDTVNPTGSTDFLSTKDTTPFLTGNYYDANGVASMTIEIASHVYTAITNYLGVLGDWGAQVTHVLGSGSYDVITSVRDLAGNIGNNTTSDAVTIDSVKPNLVKFSSTTNNGTYGIGGNINITAEYNEDLDSSSHLIVTLNTTPAQSVTLEIVSGHNISGTYTVQAGDSAADLTVSAITHEDVNDVAMNRRTDSSNPTGTDNIGESKNIVVDGVAPVVAITDNFLGTTANGNVTFTFTFSEAVNGFTVGEVTVGGGTKAGTFATGVDGDSVYTLVVNPNAGTQTGTITVDVAAGVAKDATLNDNIVATQATQAYDTVAPTVAITDNIADGTTANGNVTFTFTFSEAVNGFIANDAVVTGGTKGAFTGADGASVYTLVVTPTTATQTGTITVNVAGAVAQDLALNNNAAATEAIQAYDTAAPSITITRTPNQDLNSGGYTIAVTFGDSVSEQQYKVDGALPWTNYTVPFTVTGDGPHTIDAHGTDSAGNTGNATQATFTIDTLPPTASITSPIANAVVKSGNVSLAFDATGGSVCEYKVKVGTGAYGAYQALSCASPQTITLADGRNSVVLKVTDAAGNPAESTAVSFVVDTNNTLTVDDTSSTNPDFVTIQSAIDAVTTSGETIAVAEGAYAEKILIEGKTNLTLQGVGDGSLIEPAYDDSGTAGITIKNSNGLTINDLKIHTAGREMEGIWVYGFAFGGNAIIGLTIHDTTISVDGGTGNTPASGIIGDSAGNATHSGWSITDNTITTNAVAIALQDVTASTLSGNTVTIPYGTGGTNVLWTSERFELANLVFSNNIVSGSGGSQVSIITDYNQLGSNVAAESPIVNTSISGVTFSGNTFSNWGSRAIRVGNAAGIGEVSGIAINSNTFQMTRDIADVIGGTATDKTGTGNIFNVNSPAKIQVAIDDAFAGDTINVAAGTYPENLIVNKSLTLKGVGVDTTIAGNINTTGDNVTIQDLKVTNSNLHDGGVSDYGVKVTAGKALTLEAVTVAVSHDAVSMRSVSPTVTTITINNSSIKGYAAIELYDPANSPADTNADVNITVNNTSLTGTTSSSGGSSDFSTIGSDYVDDVHINFTGTSSVTNEFTGGATSKERLIWFYYAGGGSVTGTPTYTNAANSTVNADALFMSSVGYTNTVAGQVVARYVTNSTEFETALAESVITPIVVGNEYGPIETTKNNTLGTGTTLRIEANTPVTIRATDIFVNNGTIVIESGATLTNNGTLQSVSITGDAKYGQVLTAAVTGITNAGTPVYQWKRNGTNIDTATAATYTLGSADIGTIIKATATVTGITGSITSAGTGTVANADQATLVAVATSSTVVYGTISTLSTTGGSGTGEVTYSVGGSTGCSVSGSTLSVTNASDTCAVTATKAADANYGLAISAALTITLQKANSTTTVTCSGDQVYAGSAITPCTVSVTGAGGLSLTPPPNYTANTNVGTVTVSYAYAGDDNHTSSTDSKTFAITAKPITVTAEAKTKQRGVADDPALTYIFDPALVSGDGFSGGLVRDAGEGVGTFPIRQGTVSAGTNYAITYVGANLTISDTIAPTVAVTMGSTAFKIGETTTVTFTFSEAPTGFDGVDVAVGSGSIGAINSSNPLIQTATFTPAVATTNATNIITVGTGWTDAINSPAGPSSSANYTVDTLAPTVTATIASNNANNDYAKVLNEVTITFTGSEALLASPTATIAGNVAIVAPTANPNEYTAKYTMASSGDAEGVVPFTINFSDLAGNAGVQVTSTTNSSSVTFDKTAPSEPNFNSIGGKSGTGKWFSAKPGIDIDFSDNYMLEKAEYRLDNSGGWRTITDSDVASFTDGWDMTDGDWSGMSQGENHYIYIQLTDKAGNVYNTSDDVAFALKKDIGAPNAPTYNSPAEGQTFDSNPTLNMTFSDSWTLDKVKYQLDGVGGTWISIGTGLGGKTYTTNWSMTTAIWDELVAGIPHYIYFQITDDAGNEYITGGNGAGFLFYKNSGSDGVVSGVESSNGDGSVQGDQAPAGDQGVLGDGVSNEGLGVPAPTPWYRSLPFEVAAVILFAGSTIWWWIRRRGSSGGASGFSNFMFTTLKTAAKSARMFLW